MSPATILNNLLENLEKEDYDAAISYIEYLSVTRKKANTEKSKQVLSDIQKMFDDDKGWSSEEEMLEDMASFRKDRMSL